MTTGQPPIINTNSEHAAIPTAATSSHPNKRVSIIKNSQTQRNATNPFRHSTGGMTNLRTSINSYRNARMSIICPPASGSGGKFRRSFPKTMRLSVFGTSKRTLQLDTTEQEIPSGGITEENRKSVQFDSVSCRVYAVSVDDNPAVSVGPAIALSGWTFEEKDPMELGEYEKTHPHTKTMKDLRLSSADRDKILRHSGASRREIQSYLKRTNIAKRKRAATLERLNNQYALPEEKIERTLRAIKRMFGLKKSSKDEIKQLWNKANDTTSSSKSVPSSPKPRQAAAA